VQCEPNHTCHWLHRIEEKPHCKLLYEQNNLRVTPVSQHGCPSCAQSLSKLILCPRILPLRFTHCLVLDYKRMRTDSNDLPCHYLFIHEFTGSAVVLVIICCHEMTVCGFFHWSVMMIDGDRWLFFTDGNISKWHHCNDRAAYMTDIKPVLGCFYVTLLKIQNFFTPYWSLKPFI